MVDRPDVQQTPASVPGTVYTRPGTHACKHSTWDVEAGGLGVLGHPWLHIEFVASMSYRRL